MDRERRLVRWTADRLATLGLAMPPLPTRPSTVVVGLDGTLQSRAAPGWAAFLADRVHLLMATTRYAPVSAGASAELKTHDVELSLALAEQIEREAELIFRRERGRLAGVDVVEHVVHAKPSEALLHHAVKHDASMVAVGHTGLPSELRARLGSVSETLIHGSHVPLLIARNLAPPEAKHRKGAGQGPIIGAIGRDHSSAYAGAWAAAMALWTERPLVLAHVDNTGAAKKFAKRGPKANARVLDGKPGAALRELAAKTDALMIVMGHERPAGVLGSVAVDVVRSAMTSVLVARPPGMRYDPAGTGMAMA